MIIVMSARFVLMVDGQEIVFEFDENGRRSVFDKNDPVNASEVRLAAAINNQLVDILESIEELDHPPIVPDPPEVGAD